MADQLNVPWRPMLRRRLAVVTGVLVLWSVGIEARLIYLQIFEHEDLLLRAETQYSRQIDAEPKRGDILDRDGNALAYSIEADSIFAVPANIEDPEKTADALCKALNCGRGERETYWKSLTKRSPKGRLMGFVWVKRWVSAEQAARVAALDLKGISMQREPRRYYPKRELAAQLLGYVGDGNKGLDGLEHTYDALIGGKAGTALVQVDAKGRPYSSVETAPVAGASLELTISSYIQYVAERELRDGVLRTGARAGTVIVMDPFTGELLAVASYPTFNPNPNAFKDSDLENRKNHAVLDQYEPGSTFKLVTASAAIEENVVKPTDLIDTNPGVIRFGARVIDEAKGHNYGTLTVEEVIVKSSNVGAIKIGLKVGKDRLSEYVKRFGFGTRISPHDFFRKESPGLVFPAAKLSPSLLASVSMGYNVSVTPLQMAAAVSSVANGGELIEPRVVRSIVHDGVREIFPKKVLQRTVSSGTARQLTSIMEGVVERGTAKAAQIPGFTIAGKTGTAAKAVPGGYSSTDYNVSFVGFVPSREPAFTIVVVVDSPHKVSAYGGTVAAPIFQKIAEAALRHRGIPPTFNRPPPVLIARRDEVREQPIVASAPPAIVTLADGLSASAGFPDLLGMSARDALQALVRAGVSPRIHGDGYVVNQRPAPGSPLELNDTATVWLERKPRVTTPPGQDRTAGTAGTVSRGSR